MNLSYDGLLNSSSEASQMFLRAHADKLGDPVSLRRLTYADLRVKAAGIKPDSKQYFAAISEIMNFSPEDRKTDFLDSPSKTRERKSKEAPRVSLEQLQMAEDCGISKKDVLEAMNKSTEYRPYDTSAADNYLDPNDSVSTSNEPAEMVVRLDEPKPEPRRIKFDPNSSTATHLSPVELELISNMAVTTGRPEKEVLREFAENKIRLREGKSGHYQTYDAKRAGISPEQAPLTYGRPCLANHQLLCPRLHTWRSAANFR